MALVTLISACVALACVRHFERDERRRPAVFLGAFLLALVVTALAAAIAR